MYVKDQRSPRVHFFPPKPMLSAYLINIEFTTDIVKACVQVIEEIYDLKAQKRRKSFRSFFWQSKKMDWKATVVVVPLGECFGLRVR